MESSIKCELEITQDELDEIQVTIKDVQENLNSAIKDIDDAKYALEKEKKDIDKTIELVTHVKNQLDKWLQVSTEAQKSKDEKCTLTPQKIFMKFSEKYEDKKTVINWLQGIGKGFFSPMPFLMCVYLVVFDFFYCDLHIPYIPKINTNIQIIAFFILLFILLFILGILIVKKIQSHTAEEKKKPSRTLNFMYIIFFLLISYELALIFQIDFSDIRDKITERFNCISVIYLNIITIMMMIFDSIREINNFFTEDEEKKAEEVINEVLKNNSKSIDVLTMIIDSMGESNSDLIKIFANSSLSAIISVLGSYTILKIIIKLFEVDTIEQKLYFFLLILFGVDIICFSSKRNNRKEELFISVLKKMRFNQALE